MLDNYQKQQPNVYKILTNAVRNNRFSHAYLFETNGCNNSLDIAKSFAKTLFCKENKTNNINCGLCTQCTNIDDNNYLELKIIEPDGMWIKKEQLDELQDIFSKTSILSNKKIYIINNAERMNDAASNSILKFLEEPEDNIVAILITDNVYQLLDTVISRCQIISLNKDINEKKDSLLEKIGSYLYNNREKIDDFIDKNGDNYTQSVINFVNYYEKKGLDLLLYTNKYWHDIFKDKENIAIGLEIMVLYYKDVLKYKLNKQIDIFNDYLEDIEQICNNNTYQEIGKKINVILQNKQNINNNVNNNLLIDKIIIEMNGGIESA